MTMNKTTIAMALALASTASFADAFTLDLSTGSAVFGRMPAVGAFLDTYDFSLVEAGYLISVSAGSAATNADHDLDFTSLVIKDSADATFAILGSHGNDANESYSLPSMPIPPGAYRLIISGSNSPGQAAYSGNVSIAVAAVPEPETYALMLAGLGFVGFVSLRRKQDRSDA